MALRKRILVNSVGLASAIAPGPTGRLAFRLFCTPPRRKTPSSGEAKLALRMGPLMAQARAHDIATHNGQVRAYAWKAAGSENAPSRGQVLLVHGWTGRALVMGAFVQPLREAGFDVVALDLPAHGDSDGKILNLALGAKAVQAVADQLGPFEAAITHSFGGPVTLLAVEGGAPLTKPMPVGRLVLIAAPNSLGEITRWFGTKIGLGEGSQRAMEGEVLRIAGRHIDVFRCDQFAAHIAKPMLVIHDENDVELPIANAEAIVKAAATATLMRTTKLGHRKIIFAPSVIKAAVEFLALLPQRANV
jgi:pimeloyl-ACP methyl ester carboxylesterase